MDGNQRRIKERLTPEMSGRAIFRQDYVLRGGAEFTCANQQRPGSTYTTSKPLLTHILRNILRPLLLGSILLQTVACVHMETPSPVATAAGSARPAGGASQAYEGDSRSQLSEVYGELPLSFEANHGQIDAEVKFLSRGRGYTLFLTPTETVLSLQRLDAVSDLDDANAEVAGHAVVRLQLIGANPDPEMIGQDEQPGKVLAPPSFSLK